MRVLLQDLYGHDSDCVMPNPLAKTWESNSGSYLCMPLVLHPLAPIPSHTSTDPDHWFCGTEWVHSTTPNEDSDRGNVLEVDAAAFSFGAACGSKNFEKFGNFSEKLVSMLNLQRIHIFFLR